VLVDDIKHMALDSEPRQRATVDPELGRAHGTASCDRPKRSCIPPRVRRGRAGVLGQSAVGTKLTWTAPWESRRVSSLPSSW
jgi:hypothetical protein